MILPAPSFPPVASETGPERVARIVRAFAGCSLSNRRAELAALVGRGIDDESVVTWQTNCLTFALGVLAAAGVDCDALRRPLKNGQEGAVIAAIAAKFSAWRTPTPGEQLPTGALIWYDLPDGTDDHYEFMLAAPDEHGGGGRPNNEITVGHGDYHWSWGRAIHRWLDPLALGLPEAEPVIADDAAGGSIDPDATIKPT